MKENNLILLHICCAPCAIYVINQLKKEGYEPIGYYYNPNIYPIKEYKKRLNEIIKLSKLINFDFIIGKYEHDKWLNEVKGLENEQEGGKRCEKCYKIRLIETEKKAKEKNIKYFTTTLTISPHKKAKIINSIGKEIGERDNLYFLERDFKKKDGFKISIKLSKEYNLYRQNYCGCEFSIRK